MATKKAKLVSKGEFKGNALVVLGDPTERYNFSFGKGKANKLVDAIESDGVQAVLAVVYEIAERDLPKSKAKPKAA